jgi:hypothetical protein
MHILQVSRSRCDGDAEELRTKVNFGADAIRVRRTAIERRQADTLQAERSAIVFEATGGNAAERLYG